MRIFQIIFLIVLFFNVFASAQQSDVQLGADSRNLRQTQGALFDYSDPTGINIKVAVWGYVKHTGRYIIPDRTTVTDLLSYSGGPLTDALLDNLAIFRMKADSTQEYIKLNYNSLYWEERYKPINSPVYLKPGDILLVPGEPRFFFRDYFSILLSIISTVTSLVILIYTITVKK